MSFKIHTAIFALISCISIIAKATPAQEYNISKYLELTDTGTVECAPSRTFRDPRPMTSHCLDAELQLPELHGAGRFHSGDPVDDYSLPVTKSVKSCTIIVDIPEGYEDVSEWMNMRFVAHVIIERCGVGMPPIVGRTGGSVLTGENSNINVTVTGTPGYRDSTGDTSPAVNRPSRKPGNGTQTSRRDEGPM